MATAGLKHKTTRGAFSVVKHLSTQREVEEHCSHLPKQTTKK